MIGGIVDVEAWAPAHRVDNSWFEGIGLTDQWIIRRSGIESRAWFDAAADPTEAAAEVVASLANRADPSRISALLVSSTSNAEQVPGIAPVIATGAGLAPGVLAIDLNAACSGFVMSAALGLSLISSGMADEVVVCCVEAMSRLTNLKDRQTAFLFGDGVAAVRLAACDEFRAPMVTAGCDAAFAKTMRLADSGIELDGIEVFEHAVDRMEQALADVTQDEPVSAVLPHQANGRIIEQIRRLLPDSAPPVVNQIRHLGNTSSASVPLALALAVTGGDIPPSGRLAALSYGAGEAWGGVAVDYDIDSGAVGCHGLVQGSDR